MEKEIIYKIMTELYKKHMTLPFDESYHNIRVDLLNSTDIQLASQEWYDALDILAELYGTPDSHFTCK